MASAPQVPAGWYPNPDGTPSARWWDGAQWTEAVAPVGPPPPSGAGASPGPSRAPVAGRTGLALAVTFLSVAVVLGIPSLVAVVRTVARQFVDAPAIAVPNAVDQGAPALALQEGDYYLYAPGGAGALASADVRVQTGGAAVPVSLTPSGTQDLTRDGVTYTATVGFHAARAGSYTVAVAASVPYPHRVIVAMSFTSLAASVAGWALALLGAFLLGVTGIVLLVVSLVARSKARRQGTGVGT